MKIYLNPYRRVIRDVKPKDEAFLHSLGIPYDKLWEDSEVIPILQLMAGSTQVCFGKFDLFNKWALHSCDKSFDNRLSDALKTVYLKPNRRCTSCALFYQCMNIHLSIAELEVLWQEIYTAKAEMFKK